MKKELQILVDRIFLLNQELNNLRGWRFSQSLGMPARQQEVEDIERRFSVQLPSDYRDFLLMHNGWRGFEGQLDLLSTSQMVDTNLMKNFANVRALAEEGGNVLVSKGFIIQGCETSADILFYDFGECTPGQFPELVRWEHEVIDRYPNFVAYLKDSENVLKEMVSEAQKRVR